jgi:hypothetical protein
MLPYSHAREFNLSLPVAHLICTPEVQEEHVIRIKELGSRASSFCSMLFLSSAPRILQEKAEVSKEKIEAQKKVDEALLPAIEKVADLKSYLGARFSLTSGVKPHELVF